MEEINLGGDGWALQIGSYALGEIVSSTQTGKPFVALNKGHASNAGTGMATTDYWGVTNGINAAGTPTGVQFDATGRTFSIDAMGRITNVNYRNTSVLGDGTYTVGGGPGTITITNGLISAIT